jgi:hypothetical protein
MFEDLKIHQRISSYIIVSTLASDEFAICTNRSWNETLVHDQEKCGHL